jgi:hypothetical protein
MRLVILLSVILFSCGQSAETRAPIEKTADREIKLSDRILLTGNRSGEFGGNTFNPVALYLDNKLIFADSTREYLFNNIYPKLLQGIDGSFQVLFEADNRPDLQTLKKITISADGSVSIADIPYFAWDTLDLDRDGKPEFSGYLTGIQSFNDTAAYNPLLVYELTGNGIFLDTIATIKKNKSIWGNFYGFKFDENILLKFSNTDTL